MVIDRKAKLRARRVFRKRKRQVADLGQVTESSIDKYLFRRLTKLLLVRRFIFGWITLIVVLCVGVLLQTRALSTHYQKLAPASGGTYREGIVGTFTNANPLYSLNSVDASVSELVFSGLLKYDQDGKLVPDLAERFEYDTTETRYTVYLKKNIKWHDGESLDARDVVFTYSRIKDPAVRSHLFSSWKGVVVEAKDDYTIEFSLPTSLSAFPHSLTNGIIPEHVLESVPPEQLRASRFNNETPIGTGPFRFQAVEVANAGGNEKSELIGLRSNPDYHDGAPKIDRFVIKTYQDEIAMLNALQSGDLEGAADVDGAFDQEKAGVTEYSIPLTSQVMVFFRNTQDVLKDPAIRKALVLGSDRQAVIDSVSYPLLSVDAPLLRSHVGYDKSLTQATNNKEEAAKILDQAGWVKDPSSGLRSKEGVKLAFKLYSGATGEYTSISGTLQKQWRDLGVDVEVVLQADEELQSTVSAHNYDALLYGVSVGPDPDVYAYWHSSQADIRSDTRLNLSEYKSTVADRALEAGRTRSDVQLRAVKYRPFLEAWRNDVPALALYQPRFLYLTSDILTGFNVNAATVATDRYANVEDWSIRQRLQDR